MLQPRPDGVAASADNQGRRIFECDVVQGLVWLHGCIAPPTAKPHLVNHFTKPQNP